MKERGIIFNTEMIKAILDGRKTQTRRVMKSQPLPSKIKDGDYWFPCKKIQSMVHVSDFIPKNNLMMDAPKFFSYCCPLGGIGDHLYVRETYCEGRIDEYDAEHPLDRYLYVDQSSEGIVYKEMCISDDIRIDEVVWKPSIHMPKKFARIWLEITDVRVERLNDISERDCVAEGVGNAFLRDYKKPQFQALWDAIYNNWDQNPWVWVIEFRKVY